MNDTRRTSGDSRLMRNNNKSCTRSLNPRERGHPLLNMRGSELPVSISNTRSALNLIHIRTTMLPSISCLRISFAFVTSPFQGMTIKPSS